MLLALLILIACTDFILHRIPNLYLILLIGLSIHDGLHFSVLHFGFGILLGGVAMQVGNLGAGDFKFISILAGFFLNSFNASIFLTWFCLTSFGLLAIHLFHKRELKGYIPLGPALSIGAIAIMGHL